MNDQQRASAQRILDMFLHDERRHFEENDRPEDHIYRDLLKLQEFLAAPNLLVAAQAVLDDEDNTGCEDCTVVSQSAINNLQTAVEALNENAQPVQTQDEGTGQG